MEKATRAQWIKCAIVILLYLAFLVWVKSWWGLIVVPFIFDIYITKKVPWSFWKKSKNSTVRNVMSWVDGIGSCILREHICISKLSDTFFFFREISVSR